MRAVQLGRYGGPEVLEEVDLPEPAARPGQVRVRVAASTVNPVDLFTRSGALAAMSPHEPPLVLGWDLAGVVAADAGGSAPDGRPWAGRRVVGMVPWFAAGTGTYAEVVAADPAWLVPLPEGTGLDDAPAATLPLNALTARQALDLLRLAPGASVVVTGASGAVGGFAVQLASAAGARVIAVASAGDEEYVSRLGAHHVIGRGDASALAGAVRGLVPGGADAVLDAVPVGPALIGAVRDGGAFVTVLDPAAPQAERGVRVGKVSVEPDAAQLAELVALLAGGRLETRVAGTLPLAEAADAHRRAEKGGTRGKLVLTL